MKIENRHEGCITGGRSGFTLSLDLSFPARGCLAKDIGMPPRRINEIVKGNRALTA